MRRLLAVLDAISEYSGRFVAFLSLPLVAVIIMGVVARYIFRAPFLWTHEMMEFTAAFIFALGGAYVLRHHAHVSVDLLHKRLSIRGRAIMDAVASIFFFIYIFVLSYAGVSFGLKSLMMLETSGTPWNPPVYPVKMALGVAFILILLAGVANFIRYLRTAFGSKEEVQTLEADTTGREVE